MNERTFTATDKLKAAEREIAFRRNVYRRKVAAGTMSQAEADRQIGVMEAIRDDYRTVIDLDRQNGPVPA